MQPTTFTPEELQSVKQNYDAYSASRPKKKKNPTAAKKTVGGVKGLIAGLLPVAGGALGAIGGTFLGGPVGTVAGGAGGSALGETLRQKIVGGPIDKGNIAEQAAFGAVPGVFGGVKALRAGEGLTGLIGRTGVVNAKAAQAAARATQESKLSGVLGEAATKPRAGSGRIPVRFEEQVGTTPVGSPTRQTTRKLLINPQVGELESATSVPGTTTKLGRFTSGGGSASEKQVPYAELATTKTNIPVSSPIARRVTQQELPSSELYRPNKKVAVTSSVSAPKATVEATTAPSGSKMANALYDKGLNTKSRAGGYGIGEKQTGAPSLGYTRVKQIDESLAREGIKPGAPTAMNKAIESKITERGKQIDTVLDDSNVALKRADRQRIADKFLSKVEKIPDVNDLTRKRAQELADNYVKQVSDLKGHNEFKKGLNINFNQNPDSKMVADQQTKRAFRNILRDELNERAPGAKEANNAYHDLAEANDFIKAGAKDIADTSQHAGGGPMGRMLASETAQSAKAKLGGAMQKAGKSMGAAKPKTAVPAKPSNLLGAYTKGSVAKASLKQATPRLLLGGLTGAPAATDQLEAPQAEAPAPDLMSTGASTSEASSSPYPQSSFLADIQRDPKNADTYMALYKELNPEENSVASAAAQKQLMGTTTANSLVDQIEQEVSEIPAGLVGGTASSILGKFKPDAGPGAAAEAYNQARGSKALMLIKAIQGSAGQISDADRAAIENAIPLATDSEGIRTRKLGSLRQIINAYMGSAQEAGGAAGAFAGAGL